MEKELSTSKLIWLHLYPGILIVGLYILLTPTINSLGLPSVFSLMLCFLIVIVPFELGFLIHKSRKKNGAFSLKGILVNEAVARKKFIGVVIMGVIISFLVAGVSQVVDASIREKIFSWLPKWYLYDEEFSGYSQNELLLTAVTRIFVDGMIIPFVEEVYFRGYLLPKIKGNGLWVPIFASFLFAIYHFWQPWNYISLFIISAVLVFPAWYFKNYKMSLYIHMIINLSGSILFLLMIMN